MFSKKNKSDILSFLFENKTLKQTFIKNTFWLAVGNTASRLAKLALVIYAARALGAEGYGVFSYTIGLIGFFSIFSDIGLTNLLTREVVQKPEHASSYLSTTFALKVILLSLTAITAILVAPHFTNIAAARPIIPLAVLIMISDNLRSFGFSINRARNKMELEGILTFLGDAVIALFGIVFLIFNKSPFSLSLGYITGGFLSAGIIVVVLRGQFKNILSGFNKSLIKPILTAAWPFAIMATLGVFMLNIDTVIIGWFRSASELGLYGVAQRPVLILYVIPGFLGSGLFPILSKLAKEGEAKIKEIVEKTLSVSAMISLPLVLGGIVLGKPLIILLFGQVYSGASLSFQILISTLIFTFIDAVLGNLLFAFDKQKNLMISSVIGAVANTALDFILIPKYGIAGSAIATVISLAAVTIYVWLIAKKITSFKLTYRLKKIFSSAAIMTIVALGLNQIQANIIFNILISSTTYFFLLLVLREPLIHEFSFPSLLSTSPNAEQIHSF